MKTMIITGASSGVGRALAEHFAKQDWSICAIARTAEKLKELEANYPGLIAPYVCDISKADNVRQTFNTILEKHPAPDVLVNNAGGVTKGFMEEDELDIIDQGIDVNLKGTMYCTGAVVPAMKKAKSGLIINIASIAGLDFRKCLQTPPCKMAHGTLAGSSESSIFTDPHNKEGPA